MSEAAKEVKNPIQEIVQPFKDLVHAPRALWGINFSYFIEGFVYFGMLGYMTHFFSQFVLLNDTQAGWMTTLLTAGITISMFFFGGISDKFGVRKALLGALGLMLIGRAIISLATGMAGGWLGAAHLLSMAGIGVIVIGYGMYQPAAYSAVKQFTTEKNSAMGYAMLYALMNLGGWLPSFFPKVRETIGIDGAYWVFTALTGVGLVVTFFLLSRKIVDQTIARMADARKLEAQEKRAAAIAAGENPGEEKAEEDKSAETPKGRRSVGQWLKEHPLADIKFSFFIFSLIPVQTLFAYNWLVLPKYVERAYAGTWIGKNFETAVNFNPLLIFILVPIVTALTQKKKVYNMMILGTAVMAAPTFLLALGANFYTLVGYLVIMTIGEAMWQPRFLQYAAEIAPPGRTGAYMGVAQLPWFLTKMIAGIYSGWFLMKYCPEAGSLNTEFMWLVFGCIAMVSPILLIATKGWLGKDFKSKA
ncbi:MFS transporter [Myxococcota bacterium]|nr:MFS transporter [Myxococcota bacterium]